MKTTYKITNKRKSNGVRIYVDGVTFNQNNGSFSGTVTIIKNDEQEDITGEHGANDYKDEYGFILISEL